MKFTILGIFLASAFISIQLEIKSPTKCIHIRNPIAGPVASEIRYLPSVVQCAVYCEHYQNSSKFFTYEEGMCMLYASYPGYSDPPLDMTCSTDPATQSKYCLVRQFVTVQEASLLCRSHFMSLLSLETPAENDFIFDFINSTCGYNCGGYIWTSGQFSLSRSQLVWSETGGAISFFHWAVSNPVSGRIALGIWPGNSRSSFWYNMSETAGNYPICEI